jgi:release factor glutamine methyltransferase
MNIRDLLRQAATELKISNSTSPRLDAEVLLASYLHTDRLELYKAPEKPLSEEECRGFRKWLERRLQAEPVAYIIGFREFWSLLFEVNREVLIPRPETEILVEEALQAGKNMMPPALRILEIGVGSGAISVALARDLPDARVMATDISAGALALARRNALTHGVADRIEFLCGDLYGPVVGIFDLIVSNPPYIGAAEFAQLPRSVREYEPREALLAEENGTASHREIIAGSRKHLRKGGWLLMEMGTGQKEIVAGLLEKSGAFVDIEARRDYGGVERVIIAKAS